MLIDSHCHLDFPELACEQDAVVERARATGLKRIITVSTRVRDFDSLKEIAERYEDVFCTVGTHPHNAHEEEVSATALVELSRHPKCVGIGEAGLDYHYDKPPRDVAQRVFRTHIAAARQSGLPICIHARDADQDIAATLREEMAKGPFRGLLHCFAGSRALAEAALSLGLYISFSGILTFKNSQPLRDIARTVPMNRLLIETDAPFLAPVPYRGKRNEPAFVAETARVLAEIKGVAPQAMAAATSANALRLFSKMPAPATGAEAA